MLNSTHVADPIEDVEIDLEEMLASKIVVYNDDVNTFHHVIDTFMKVLKHSAQQAEQCAYLIHYKGKCAVKSGTRDELKPYRDALTEAELDARIED
jgi:ATP-dependent Clp protease adaptor protein ClpS